MDKADQKRSDEQVVEQARAHLEQIAKACARDMNAGAVTFWLYDAEARRFDLPVQHGLLDPDTFLDPRLRARTYGRAGAIVKRMGAVTNYDIGHERPISVFAIREQISEYVAVPITVGDYVCGVLFVNYRHPNSMPANALRICRGFAGLISNRLDLPGVLQAVRRQRAAAEEAQNGHDREHLEQTLLRTVVESAAELTPDYCLAVWRRDVQQPHLLKVCVGAGITSQYLDGGVVHIRDDAQDLHASGHGQRAVDAIGDAHHRGVFADCFHHAGWRSQFCIPIEVRGMDMGALEVLSFREPDMSRDARCRNTAERTASILGVVLENFDRSRESEVLRAAALAIAANPDLDQALELVLKFAHDLTKAEYAAVLLPSANNSEVRVRARSPQNPPNDPRDEILQQRAPQDIAAERDILESIRPGLPGRGGGAKSLFVAGVGIQVAGEPKGMLYVLTSRERPFALHDVHLLNLLATQASAGLGWIGMLFTPLSEVEEATARLMVGPEKLSNACSEIKAEALGADFVAIQRVYPEQGIVKTDWSCGLQPADSWAGRSGHFLHRDPSLQDIQASMAVRAQEDLEPPIEALTGWDDRFDRYIYEHFQHDRLTRIFIPLIVFLTVEGKIDDRWYRQDILTAPEEVRQRDPMAPRKLTRRRVWKMRCGRAAVENYKLVLGTVEVGYDDPKRRRSVTNEELERIVKVVAHHACEIYQTTLTNVFNVIMRGAKQISAADVATFHFKWTGANSANSDRGNYTYTLAGGIAPSVFHTLAPRASGLGRQAVMAGHALFKPDLDAQDRDAAYRAYNPDLYQLSIRSSAAFPLILSDGRDGVLYLHFKHYRLITETDIQYVSFFVNRAKNAIALATSLASYQDQTAVLDGLQNVTQTVAAARSELLGEVAWNALNVLAADVVTIYEVVDGSCLAKPATAGRLLHPDLMQTEVGGLDAPMNVLRHGKPVYASEAVTNGLLHPVKSGSSVKRPFVVREEIASACAIPLVAANSVVGILFANYRRPSAFDDKTRHMIDVLAASAALAITNHRSMARLEEIADLVISNMTMEHALTAIKGFAQELSAMNLDEQARRKAIQIGDRAGAEIDEFRSRTQASGLMPVRFDVVDLSRSVTLAHQANTTDRIRFNLRVPTRPVWAHTIESHIKEVLDLLVSNAADELMAVSRIDRACDCCLAISVNTTMQNHVRLIRIVVEDSGRGIPPDLGDPCGRGVTGKSDLTTRGMGLFYARFRIERVGGTVELLPYHMKDGRRVTRFEMTFPAHIPARFDRTQAGEQ